MPQDDDGRGVDAPDAPDNGWRIAAGSDTRGALVSDYEETPCSLTSLCPTAFPVDVDVYAFDAFAGQVAVARVAGVETCVRIVDASGEPVDGEAYWSGASLCAASHFSVGVAAFGEDRARIPADGTYFVALQTARGVGLSPYELAFGFAGGRFPLVEGGTEAVIEAEETAARIAFG